MKKVSLLLAVILIAAVAVFALGSGEESSSATTGTVVNQEQATPTQETEADPEVQTEAPKAGFAIGETAQQKDVAVTLVNVTESEGSSFNTPADGNIYVLCEFEIQNNSSKELTVSSLLSFEAYCDDYTCTYSLGALMEKGDKNQLDGTVAAGKKLNGVIGYEVPTDWQELEIHFTPDVWVGKSMVFVATNN